MTLTRGFATLAGTSALDARLADMAKVVSNSDRSPRVGVLTPRDNIVTATSGWGLTIGIAEFVTSKAIADGVMIFANDGPVTVSIDPAPVTGARIDVLYVKHNDAATGDTDSLPLFAVATGVAAAEPVEPSVPTGALRLAVIRVAAGATAANHASNTLLNIYPFTAMRGGAVPFRTRVELETWTNAYPGQTAYVLGNTGGHFDWTGLVWVPRPVAQNIGAVNVSGDGGVIASQTFSFPVGRFTVPPAVFPRSVVNSTGTTIDAQAVAISSTGATMRISAGGQPINSNYTIEYWAVQMLPATPYG